MLVMAHAVMRNLDVILLDEVFRIILRLKQEGMTMLLVEQFAAAASQ